MQRSQTVIASAQSRRTLHEWVHSTSRRGVVARLLVITALAFGVAAMHTLLDGAHPTHTETAAVAAADQPAAHAFEGAGADKAGPMSHMCMTLLTLAVFGAAVLPGLSGLDLLGAASGVAPRSVHHGASGQSRILRLCVLRL